MIAEVKGLKNVIRFKGELIFAAKKSIIIKLLNRE